MIRKTIYILLAIMALTSISLHAQDEEMPVTALRVETTPEAAEVYIDNRGPFPTPYVATGIMHDKQHLVVIKKKNYLTHRQSISLAQGQRVPLNIELTPMTGLVLIHTKPTGVNVKIDDSDQGKTPLLLTDISLGDHKIQLTKPGFIPKMIDLDINSRAPLHINETLTPNSASLNLSSTPNGAKITLNGVSYGTTPNLIAEIPEGTTTLELALTGYEPYKKTIKLTPGQKANLNAELKAIPAGLTVITIPSKARIYINNEFKGESPVTLKNLKPGSYRIRAEMAGFEATARTIELENASNPTEELRLDANCGKLEIVTQPAGIKVFVAGQERGITSFKPDETDKVSNPLTIDLIPEGEHEVKLTGKQVFPRTFRIIVKKNETTIVHPQKLKRRFIPDIEIRTNRDVFTGVMLGTTAEGDVRLEVRPGIVKTIPLKDIKVRRPLTSPKLDD